MAGGGHWRAAFFALGAVGLVFALPYYQYREGEYFQEAVLPLWFHRSYPGATSSLLLPFFWIRTDTVEHITFMVLGALIILFLIVEPNALARLWQIGKQKLRVWPFPY